MRTFAVLTLLALVALAVATESETPVENTNQAPEIEMAMPEAPAAVSQATAEKTTDTTESLTQVGWRRRRRRRRRRYIRRRRWIGSAGERNAKNAERSNKERANKERANKARERANKERSSKARERSAKERAGKAARERSAKERRAKAVARERYNKVVERRNKNASRERRNKAVARERKAKRIATETRGKESRAKKAIEARNKRERSGKRAREQANKKRVVRERKAKKVAKERVAARARFAAAIAAKIRREKNGKEKKSKAKQVELKRKRAAAVAKYKEDTAKKRKKRAAAAMKKGKEKNAKLHKERVGKRSKERGQKVRKLKRKRAQLKRKAHKRSAKKAKTTLKKLKKGGATNADCVDLANTMCKTVEKEVSTDQTLIDRLKDGKQCVNLGLKAVRTATAHLVKTRRIQGQWKVKVSSSYNARINFGYHTFSSLREGKCGQFFTSRSYRTASHRHRRNVKIEASWSGRVKEAVRVLIQVKLSRKRQVKRCHCATKRARNLLWRTVTKRSRMSRQIKAHAKCKMLKCVLTGTPLRSRKCRASLKRLRTKKLISATETVRGCGKTTRRTGFKRRVVRRC